MAQRIVSMGNVVSLVEKAQQHVDEKQPQSMTKQ
jgi:signal recognition particle GTPase